MTNAREYYQRLKIFTDRFRSESDGLEIKARSIGEFKLEIKRISQTKKELQLLKKEVRLTMRDISSAYNAEIAKVGNPSITKGIMAGLFGKRSVGRRNVVQREQLRQTKRSELQTYEELILMIDQITLFLDRLKLKAERALAEN